MIDGKYSLSLYWIMKYYKDSDKYKKVVIKNNLKLCIFLEILYYYKTGDGHINTLPLLYVVEQI